MKTLGIALLALQALGGCWGDAKVNDYVYWKKADMAAWHQYFPSRALEEERLTITAAMTAARNMSTGLEESLRRMVQYQARELTTARLMMEGTNAQGCVEGVASSMDIAIQNEISNYEDCAADIQPKLDRLINTWNRTNSNYQSAFQRAIDGMNACAKTYPNWDSKARLKICVDMWNNKYFIVANSTKRTDVFASPSMVAFTSSAVQCAEAAGQAVIDQGWNFLRKLVQCSKLSGNIDPQTYEDEILSGFTNYLTRNDLINQTKDAQLVYNSQVSQLEQEMLYYYNLQKRALEHYVIASRDSSLYHSQMVNYLSNYYLSVSTVASDNPADLTCADSALAALNTIASSGSAAALQCDQNIVTNTKILLADVNANFFNLNKVLPSTGNAAILKCFSQGYIFMENTISKCFTLASSNFTVNNAAIQKIITNNVQTLQGYEVSFFNNPALPCGDSILQRSYQEANQILYDLERCLYINSGTKYPLDVNSTSMPFLT